MCWSLSLVFVKEKKERGIGYQEKKYRHMKVHVLKKKKEKKYGHMKVHEKKKQKRDSHALKRIYIYIERDHTK